MAEEDQMSAKDCAVRRGVSKWTIVRALAKGAIRGKKIGKVWVLTEKDCDAYPISEAHQNAGKEGARSRREKE